MTSYATVNPSTLAPNNEYLPVLGALSIIDRVLVCMRSTQLCDATKYVTRHEIEHWHAFYNSLLFCVY
jgi:hypothetical protein